MLSYVEGDLLTLAGNNIIVHSGKAYFDWKKSPSKFIKKKYPKAYNEYKIFCQSRQAKNLMDLDAGYGFMFENIIYIILGWQLLRNAEPKEKILRRLSWALLSLQERIPLNATVYSDDLHYKSLKLPWQEVEQVLLYFLSIRPDINWIVVNK